jgi:Uri superfamily endonuclease
MSARHSESPSVTFELPSEPGTYVLVLRLHWECVIEVGALGELTFAPGLWLYCGSANGPGGLSARLSHHARFSDRPRWHIDYLRFAGSPVEVWHSAAEGNLEHEWAEILAGIGGVESGPAGFGSSDCGCATHLFYCGEEDVFKRFSGIAGSLSRAGALRPGG